MKIATMVAWMRRRAENVVAGLLGLMFVAFIIQIVFRYFFNFPIGWTSELSVIAWARANAWGALRPLARSWVRRTFGRLTSQAGNAASGGRRLAKVWTGSVALVVRSWI